jgi:hypothetical protein
MMAMNGETMAQAVVDQMIADGIFDPTNPEQAEQIEAVKAGYTRMADAIIAHFIEFAVVEVDGVEGRIKE